MHRERGTAANDTEAQEDTLQRTRRNIQSNPELGPSPEMYLKGQEVSGAGGGCQSGYWWLKSSWGGKFRRLRNGWRADADGRKQLRRIAMSDREGGGEVTLHRHAYPFKRRILAFHSWRGCGGALSPKFFWLLQPGFRLDFHGRD